MITRKQLVRFAKVRNKSGYPSNLQFQIDANDCGFKVSDFGDPKPFTIDGFKGYLWNVPLKGYGTVRLVEFGRALRIEGEPYPGDGEWIPNFETADMFTLLDEKAVYLEVAA